MVDKIEIEKAKVNLEVDKTRLFNKKNFLVIKRKELRTKIAVLNIIRFINILICRYQNLFLRLIQDKFKVKRPLPFDNLKKNFQKFFIKTRYYQRFY